MFASLSVLFAGAQAIVQKVAIERGLSTVLVNSYSALISGSIAALIWLLSDRQEGVTLFATALIFFCGISYMYGVVNRSRAMRYLDVSVVLTSYKTLTVLATVIGGIFFFGEALSQEAWVGVFAAMAVPIFLNEKVVALRWSSFKTHGMVLLFLAIVMGSFGMILTKFTVSFVESMLLFTALNHLFAGAFGMGQQIYTQRGDWHKQFLDYRHPHHELALASILGGAAQCAGFFALLKAFEAGPLSLVYAVNSVYIIIPILFAMWYYQERMTFRRFIAVVLSGAAIVLIK